MNIQNPEDQPAEHALGDCRDDVAFDRGPNNRGEHIEELALLIRMQRNSGPDASGKIVAITQEKKQQVQNDAKIDRQIEGILADVKNLGGDELAALALNRRTVFPASRRDWSSQSAPPSRLPMPAGRRAPAENTGRS